MIIKHLETLIGTEREVRGETWVSRRLLLRREGMGFSMHDTILYAGTHTEMEYRNHLEAVYCIEGEGEIEDLGTGQRHAIAPGMLYALNEHDHHIVHATTDLRMVCVFNPPVTGSEVHDASGAYPLIEDDQPEPADAP